LSTGEPPTIAPLRYVRPAGDKLVLESEVKHIRTKSGTVYVSRTDRGTEQMTLVLYFGMDGKLSSAEAIQETKEGKKLAFVTFEPKLALLKRADGSTERIKLTDEQPVVTTAPDWSDVFQVIQRCDRTKAGRQELAGLWIHPVQPARTL